MRIRSSVLARLIMIGAILAWPGTGHAQEATLSGTVTDSTGGVLPGVTVTAVHEASGNTFVTVTDEHGTYRIPLRTGGHRITAELPGFATVTRSVDLLVGRAGVDGILEVFNVFNHANYGSYVTQESNRRYGNPTENLNVAYQPRMLQVGFRLTF